ncbi:MAG: hypothetical protein B7X00_01950, partial [Legionella sp. 21-45-4]
GDEFTVTSPNGKNGLAGAGYFFDARQLHQAFDIPDLNIEYGVNFFYLAKTQVSGQIVQENLFTNLAYGYNVTHYPLYAMARSTFEPEHLSKYLPNNHHLPFGITVDAGIGPNFIQTSNFNETPINPTSLPDNIYAGNSTVTFTATAGIALKFNHAFGHAPLECGYRFFYLGEGNFTKLNNQVLTTLNTGNDFGNALICSVSI